MTWYDNLLRNKASTYAPTGPFTNGGNTTKVDLPSHPDMPSLSCQQCRDTLNLPFCGKSMRILFFVNSASHLLCTNLAFNRVLLTAFVSSSCVSIYIRRYPKYQLSHVRPQSQHGI